MTTHSDKDRAVGGTHQAGVPDTGGGGGGPRATLSTQGSSQPRDGHGGQGAGRPLPLGWARAHEHLICMAIHPLPAFPAPRSPFLPWRKGRGLGPLPSGPPLCPPPRGKDNGGAVGEGAGGNHCAEARSVCTAARAAEWAQASQECRAQRGGAASRRSARSAASHLCWRGVQSHATGGHALSHPRAPCPRAAATPSGPRPQEERGFLSGRLWAHRGGGATGGPAGSRPLGLHPADHERQKAAQRRPRVSLWAKTLPRSVCEMGCRRPVPSAPQNPQPDSHCPRRVPGCAFRDRERTGRCSRQRPRAARA